VASFKRIDYRLRVAKQIERKMISEMLIRFSRVHDLSDYQYIGFGSIAFQDFSIIHRVLGIDDMLSIEKSLKAERFEFNKPYACIRIEHGDASVVVDRYDWNKKSIVWLDYDEKIDEEKLLTIGRCVQEMEPGSLVLVTVNIDSGGDPMSRFEEIKKDVEIERLPGDFNVKMLSGKEYPVLVRKIINNQVEDAFGARARVDGDGLEQFVNFIYKDGARMMTLGWVINGSEGGSFIKKSGINKLDYYRGGAEPFEIKVPILTPREVTHMNKQLPAPGGELPECPGLSEKEVADYRAVYRYYPVFHEISEH
tara:strand:- start:5296 stop:6222 length:927 start_codon:yes stop_codon:yes gene_type:complete